MNPIDRRDFLKSAGFASLAMQEAKTAGRGERPGESKPAAKWRGVNLGGWLVLEKWITPTLYAGVQAEDEYTLCEQLGKTKASARLKQHRESWITVDDFQWIAARGLNALRIPVGYAIAEENPPFVSAWESLDWAFRTAKAHGLGVLLDLHGVPGSQNGWDHSGRQGQRLWHTSKDNIDHSLRIIGDLAERCKAYDNLLGVELVNEPAPEVPLGIIRMFYRDGYARVRQHVGKDRCAVVIHDAFRPLQWVNFMQEPEYSNVILDTHPYQCFTEEDRKRDLHAHVDFAVNARRKLLEGIERQLPCLVGEWSCALPPQSLAARTGFDLDVGMRAYGAAQLINYDATRGWFFWTYKTEEGGAWSLRDCIRRGWLPDHY
jgi:glucan 1,3-beta-glucosidase